MLLPARSASPPAPDGPHRSGRDSLATPIRQARGPRRAAGLFGLLAVLAAVAFPLAPVQQPEVTYSWTAADGPAAIPLLPYQPTELTASTSCATAREAPPERVLLSTVPLRPDPAAPPLDGLRLIAAGGQVRVASAGVDLGAVELPDGTCTLSVVSDPARTSVLVDGEPVLVRDGDVRPEVAGAFSETRSGVEMRLTADTRFETTISPLKAAIGAVGGLALLGALVALRRADRAERPAARVRLLPRRWWRPRPVDGAVTALLGLWWVIGAITVDDGYIAGIVRSTGSNGFVGNAYRWLNAPEAPFSWFYDLYYAWSLVSAATPWMRLPSTLLGLLCWWLLSRLVLPRLGRFAARPWVPWVAALAFATWWIPFGLGLRPEPWVAVGALAVFLAVERALATARVLPLAVGLVLAGATTALTPAGLLAFTPFLAAGRPLLAMLRARRDLHTLPLLAVLLAAPASAVFLMVPDQSLAGMLESVRVRAVVGGGQPLFEETDRYRRLLDWTFQGAIGRRAAVLSTLLAAVGVLWSLRRTATGIASGPARRLVIGFLLSLATMALTPTKWTQHFGDLAGYGAAVLVLGAAAWSAAPLRYRPRALRRRNGGRHGRLRDRAGGRQPLAVPGRVVHAHLQHRLSPDRGRPDSDDRHGGGWRDRRRPPRPVDVAAGGRRPREPSAAPAAGARAARRRRARGSAGAAGAHRGAGGRHAPRQLHARLGHRRHPARCTVRAAGAAVGGDGPCGRAASRRRRHTGPTLPVDVGGRTLPGVAVAGRLTTPWFTLDPQQRNQVLPVVVTTSGTPRPGDGLFLEFGAGSRVLDRTPLVPRLPLQDDIRELAPVGADTVRLVVDAPDAPGAPAVASLPRAPRLTPMTHLLPPGSTALLDWPVAFLFPCLTPEPLRHGTAAVPEWRVGPPADDTETHITYLPEYGAPFVAPRLLITEQRMATYLSGDPLRDAVQLYRWVPMRPLARPEPVVTQRTVAGWYREGHARVPGIDPVG